MCDEIRCYRCKKLKGFQEFGPSVKLCCSCIQKDGRGRQKKGADNLSDWYCINKMKAKGIKITPEGIVEQRKILQMKRAKRNK